MEFILSLPVAPAYQRYRPASRAHNVTPTMLSWCFPDEICLPYLSFLFPALVNLRTRFCLRGVVLSHPKIFNFRMWISLKNALIHLRVSQELSRFFWQLFSFSCELNQFIWMALKSFSWCSNILFGLSCPNYLQDFFWNFRILGIYFSWLKIFI